MIAPPLRRQSRLSLCWALLIALVPSGGSFASDPELARADPVFRVDRFEIEYAEAHPDLPELAELLPLEVELSRDADGWLGTGASPSPVAIGLGQAAGDYHASAIARIASALLESVREEGLVGVFVAPHPGDIDVHTEQDLRPPERRTLRLQITVGRVQELRSVAVGDRVEDDWKVNNPAHRAIRRGSPIQPAALVREGTTDLVLEDELENYLFQLNRHPGRRVEAALAGAEDGGVALDLRIQEARPWFAYAQTSNTGTKRTAIWQQRVGYVHRQLTNRDDIFSFQYTNAGWDRVHAVNGSYEAPWFRKERPEWLRTQPDDPWWLSWPGRDAIPWWGLERLRWRVDGSWSSFDARDVDFVDDISGSEWALSSRLIYETLQFGNLFVDAFAGTRMRGITVNNSSQNEASEFFFLPEVGLEVERIQETSTLHAMTSFEINVSNTFDPELQLLGRQVVDGNWKVIRYDLGTSQYLEPLLFPKAWEDPSTPRSSTLSHEVAVGFRGQYAFDHRLIPQASQVIGGLYSVRGYDPSVSVGDSVWIATAEYRFHVPRFLPVRREPLNIPVLGPFRAAPQQVYGRPDWDFVIRGFVDAAKSERNPLADGTRPAGERDESLLSVGVGAEFRFRHNITARADWGYALKEAGCRVLALNEPEVCDVDRGDSRVHLLFSVVY